MAPMMIGQLLLLAASASPPDRSIEPVPQGAASFQAAGGATARATVSVRIVSAVKFGEGRRADGPGSALRSGHLPDSAGQMRPAKLLEFQ
jgi:hypothetical protein